MGCWLGTCGISNLPIFAGDPIRAVIITGQNYKLADPFLIRNPKTWTTHDEPELVDAEGNYHTLMDKEGTRKTDLEVHARNRNRDAWRNGWYAGYVCNSDVFFPRTIPVKGEYNDYGGIEALEDGLNVQVIHDQMQLDLDEYPRGQFDLPVEIKKDMPVADLLRAIERGGVTVSDRSNRAIGLRGFAHSPLGLWMVREDIYQAMLESKIEDRWGGSPLTLKRFKKGIQDFLKDISGLKNRDEETLRFINLENRGSTNPFRWAMSSPPLQRGTDFYSSWITEKIVSGELKADDPKLIDLLDQIAEFGFFQTAMNSMRVGWMPQPGAGSQDDTVSVHAAVAKQTLRTIELMRAEWAEEEVEYEDDDG